MLKEVLPLAAHPFAVKKIALTTVGVGVPGRRSRALSSRGANIRPTPKGHGLNLVGTIMAAAERGAQLQPKLQLQPADLRGSIRQGQEANLLVFVVDSSGSMAGIDRLEAASSAVMSILQDAYRRRDQVALITVRGDAPELVLPPTGSIEVAVRRLQGLPTGGRTPLGEGLELARQVIIRQRYKEPGRRAIVVVFSDGRATGGAKTQGLTQAASALAKDPQIGAVVVDCEQGRVKLGLARKLAATLGAPALSLAELQQDGLGGAIAAW